MTVAVAMACLIAALPASARWLRVAQREHYLPVVARFAVRWWSSSTHVNRFLGLMAVAGAGIAPFLGWAGIGTALAQVGPVGLGVRGRTSKLALTPRLRRLAGTTGLLFVGFLAWGVAADLPVVPALTLLLLPVVVDAALVVLGPVERMMGGKWVRQARRKLEAVAPRVVAITGSYGKTTTKAYVSHLASGSLRTVASPASFNNRLGLARAVNEGLTPGTELFVAEMGTYGAGEIAEMCAWIEPEVSAIVSVGPVHLERFGTEERIVAAKAEIFKGARAGVICVDQPLLAELAVNLAASLDVTEVSSGPAGRIRVVDGTLHIDGSAVSSVPADAFSANLAVAVGVCLELGLPAEEVVGRLEGLPTTPHRQAVATGEAGFAIIDDTFNSNPAGARRALGILSAMGDTKVVVTPGMVELGPRQASENEAFAAEAARIADHLVVVGRTNRNALLRGAAKGSAAVTVVDTRAQAVDWARSNLGPGDAVLYENDLPDHYP